mgnify:CR=1 FL=1
MSGQGGGGGQLVDEREVVFRGQRLERGELRQIAAVIRRHPKWRREEIARAVCRRFGWKQGNGQLAVRACKNLLERLEREGRWQLPARRREGNFRKQAGPGAKPAVPGAPVTERCGALALRVIAGEQRAAWQEQLRAFHYLGEASIVGETLWYVAHLGAEPVAVLVWGGAALRNPPRDQYVGWDAQTRIRSLPLVANNARFLILPWVHVPNLASQILALNLRRLSADWVQAYGHPVRLAETFVDATRFRGTCYRAANWREVGETRGYSRVGAGYAANGQPKRVFVYELDRHARAALRAPCEPTTAVCKKKPVVHVELLPILGASGLFERLGQVSDPRKPRGVRHPLRCVLAIAACAVLSLARSFAEIAEWAAELGPEQLHRFGSRRDDAPSERTFRRVLGALDAPAFDRVIGQWTEQHGEQLDRALAIDGKALRGSADGDGKPVHLFAALLHAERVVLAQMAVPEKTNEIPCVKELLAPFDLHDTVVTADALHTQTETARFLVEDKGADYVFTVKDNQPTLRQALAQIPERDFSPGAGNHQ